MTLKPLTGLFLGAGASYEAGMPLVWDLTTQIKNLLTPDRIREFNHARRAAGMGYSAQVIDDLIGMLERPEAHYEAVLGHLEVQFRRQHDRKLAQEYHGLYSWLVEAVSMLLYHCHIGKPDSLKKALRFYDGIRALANANTPLFCKHPLKAAGAVGN